MRPWGGSRSAKHPIIAAELCAPGGEARCWDIECLRIGTVVPYNVLCPYKPAGSSDDNIVFWSMVLEGLLFGQRAKIVKELSTEHPATRASTDPEGIAMAKKTAESHRLARFVTERAELVTKGNEELQGETEELRGKIEELRDKIEELRDELAILEAQRLVAAGGAPGYRIEKSKAGKVVPNKPCPCGSGQKYKKCCGKS